MQIEKGLYEHYKNKKLYRVHGIARHSETLEEFVIYEPQYESDAQFWIRPLSMFLENVEYQGIKQPRFKKVGN